jgi:N-acyl-D-amino-acid deacylase
MNKRPLDTHWDTLIKNATVYDGSGKQPFIADIALKGKHIAAVGKLEGTANVTIHANHRALAPGFIDVHTHDDFAVLCCLDMDFKTMQGVTTEIVGNCGFGAAPFNAAQPLRSLYPNMNLPPFDGYAGYVNLIKETPPSINVAFLVGHGTLRNSVMGNANRKPSSHELTQMCYLLQEGLAAGALGFSSGLMYEPGCYSLTEELITLAREVKRCSGIYTTHLRNESDKLIEAINEALIIGQESGIAVQISHHKAAGYKNWGLVKLSLQLLENARIAGLDVTADQYPYTRSSTLLSSVMRNNRLGKDDSADLNANDILISSAPHFPECEGKLLQSLCSQWEVKPEDAAKKLLEKGEVFVVLNIMSEEDVRMVMKHPTTMIGSDGIPSDSGKPHPRLYGTFPKILGHYVREQKLLSLEEAIHKMTGFPATQFKLKDRGFIREKYYADLVLFDQNRIADIATYHEPRQYPLGIDYVFVNGEAVVKNGQHMHCRSGQIICRQ